MRKLFALFLAWILAGIGILLTWLRRCGRTKLDPSERIEEKTEGGEEKGGGGAGIGVPGVLPEERPTPPEITTPLGMAFTRVMRWVDGRPPQIVSVIPNSIPTSYRGKVELFTRANGTFVCQHLPHPGGKDYLLYPLEEMPLSQEELRRAERMGATVVITLQNGRVVEAKVPRGQEWGRGLWQQRSGWYRGGR